MQLGETITLSRKDAAASTGYRLSLVKLENLALTDIARSAAPLLPAIGPATVTFTFQAVKEGRGVIQFARYRPWDLSSIRYEDELVFDIGKTEGETAGAGLKLGGWTPFAKPDAEAVKAFKEAAPEYGEPLLVTSQLVAGVNYIFVANQKMFLYPVERVSAVLVRVFKPLEGPATVIAVDQLSYPVPGSTWSAVYGPAAPLDARQKAIFDRLNQRIGNRLTAFLAAPQTVAGGGFAVFANNKLVTQEPNVVPVLVTIQIPSSGGPAITGIEEVYHLV